MSSWIDLAPCMHSWFNWNRYLLIIWWHELIRHQLPHPSSQPHRFSPLSCSRSLHLVPPDNHTTFEFVGRKLYHLVGRNLHQVKEAFYLRNLIKKFFDRRLSLKSGISTLTRYSLRFPCLLIGRFASSLNPSLSSESSSLLE